MRPGKSEKAKTNERKIKSMKYSNLKIFTTVLSVLACLAFSPHIKAAPQVAPPPDGCYPAFTTAEGCQALQTLTTGSANTGVGWRALFSAGASSFNTGVGAGALVLNTGDANTAVGAAALLLNTGGNNTAVGAAALENNTIAEENTAVGAFALSSNTEGDFNAACGAFALQVNTTGERNTATGDSAMFSNTTGSRNTVSGNAALGLNTVGNDNTAIGDAALFSNVTGISNVAVGSGALHDGSGGSENTAVGISALHDATGGFNTAIGGIAGANVTTGQFNTIIGDIAGLFVTTASNTICIGGSGINVSGTCQIASIRGVTTQNANAIPVLIDSAGQLGTMSSSRRYKTDIKPMDKASEAILALKPVSFRYKVHKDPTPQFGLIAEEVAEVNPDLVVRDENGEIYTVRYDAINAMLLSEFIKEHKKVQALEATVAQQQKGMEALTAQVQKVSAQMQVNKPAPQLTSNNE
jgi:trimeric autotransporter adhesin